MYTLTTFQSYIFRDTSRKLTARRVRSKGAIALSEAGDIESYPTKAFSINTHHTGSTSSRTGTPPMRIGTPPVDMGSPQPSASPQKESRFTQFNFSPVRTLRNVRQSILPSYHSAAPNRVTHSRSSSTYSRSTSGESKRFWAKKNRNSEIPDVPLQISAPLNINPNFAHLVKPNLAHHPSQRRPENDDGLKEFNFK